MKQKNVVAAGVFVGLFRITKVTEGAYKGWYQASQKGYTLANGLRLQRSYGFVLAATREEALASLLR